MPEVLLSRVFKINPASLYPLPSPLYLEAPRYVLHPRLPDVLFFSLHRRRGNFLFRAVPARRGLIYRSSRLRVRTTNFPPFVGTYGEECWSPSASSSTPYPFSLPELRARCGRRNRKTRFFFFISRNDTLVSHAVCWLSNEIVRVVTAIFFSACKTNECWERNDPLSLNRALEIVIRICIYAINVDGVSLSQV